MNTLLSIKGNIFFTILKYNNNINISIISKKLNISYTYITRLINELIKDNYIIKIKKGRDCFLNVNPLLLPEMLIIYENKKIVNSKLLNEIIDSIENGTNKNTN